MDSCSECFLPELKKLRLFSEQYRNARTVDFLKVRLVEAIYCISSLIYGRSFCWQNYENISVET